VLKPFLLQGFKSSSLLLTATATVHSNAAANTLLGTIFIDFFENKLLPS
jgi:hypothetical protein